MRVRTAALLVIALCSGIVLAQSESSRIYYWLGDPETFPQQYFEVLAAASRYVVDLDYEASEFHAVIHECEPEQCEIAVYPRELDSEEYLSRGLPRGCPLKFCATMKYSLRSKSFESVVGWR
jgi:hypothetical protein